jgi:hypothetical protein
VSRWSRRDKVIVWIVGGAAAVMLALTGYSLLSGDDGGDSGREPGSEQTDSAGDGDDSPEPAPTYTRPDDYTEPARWAALPQVEGDDERGNPVGFPRSTEGAIAVMAAHVEANTQGVEAIRRANRSYYTAEDVTTIEAKKDQELAEARKLTRQLRQWAGVPDSGPLPQGAVLTNEVIGFKVHKADRNEVQAQLLTRLSSKAGPDQQELKEYVVSNASAVVWEDGDWKISSAAVSRLAKDSDPDELPKAVEVGDAAFNKEGWTAIREGSSR